MTLVLDSSAAVRDVEAMHSQPFLQRLEQAEWLANRGVNSTKFIPDPDYEATRTVFNALRIISPPILAKTTFRNSY